MIKATFFTSKFFLNNRPFDMSDEISNRDNCLYGIYLLKERFRERGINLSTQDINFPSESQIIIYSDVPGRDKILKEKDIYKSYLLIWECKVMRPINWNLKTHKYFKRIFTWNDNFIVNKKY